MTKLLNIHCIFLNIELFLMFFLLSVIKISQINILFKGFFSVYSCSIGLIKNMANSRDILNRVASALMIFLILFLSSCNSIPAGDARKTPASGKERARKNIEEGRGITLGGIGNQKTTYQFSSSNPMWRATFDVIDFMPLVTVDYSGGMIITDWYTDSNTTNDSLKFTIRFLSNEIRPDSLKIIVHKKTCKVQSNCIVRKISSKLEDTIRAEIITKAAQLEQASKNKKKKN